VGTQDLEDTEVFDDFKTTADDGSETSSAKSNGVKQAVELEGRLFVLDDTGVLWIKDGDNIEQIQNIKDIALGDKVVNVIPNEDNPYIYVIFGGKLRKYNYTANF
jgi:hypothetical protein